MLALLALVALAGAADVAVFTATDPGVALKTPSRAAGTLTGLAIWVLLAAFAGARWRGAEAQGARRATVALGALAAIDGAGLAVIHAAAHVGGLRSAVGGALGIAALSLALASRGR